jgi:N-acyl homoserine lactone hydrolase
MTVNLFAFTCGTVTGEFAHLMEGGKGDFTVPIPVFLIEHPKGWVLFDTGLHPDCQHDPAGRLGPRLAGLFRIGVFGRGKKSLRGSKHSTEILARSTSSSTRIFI